MKKLLIICISIFSLLQGQSLKPIPDSLGTRFFYKPMKGEHITSVSIAGAFNNWVKGKDNMVFNQHTGIWSGTVNAKPGIEYHYKFVLNDSNWITDPNAHDMTEDEWRNGILVPQEYGKPYVAYAIPALNKRITKKGAITFKLASQKGAIGKQSITLTFNGKKVKFTFNDENGILTIADNNRIKPGENIILLSFGDVSGVKSNIVHRFFYDEGIAQIKTPAYFDSAIVYEIFVRKFYDSDGNGIGDFDGITQKLDYLKNDLHINTIWLMPINESNTDHGYNVTDYYAIERDYGNMDSYNRFIKSCKDRNIKVLFDFVLNHTDSSHQYFLDAYKNPKSIYTDWYQFTDSTNSNWNHFGVERKMPKLDFDNSDVQQYFLKVAAFWMDPNGDGNFADGVDGFRCDAAKEVPHSFWNLFRKFVKQKNPDCLLLGEVWDNANYLIPFFINEFDALFNYPLLYALDEYINRNDQSGLQRRFNDFKQLYPDGYQMVTFLANHDNHRALSRYGSFEKLRMALFIIFTMPGTPMIYYGDEIGMEGSLPPENVRADFNWNSFNSQMITENRYLRLYKDFTGLRKEHTALSARDSKKKNSLSFISVEDAKLLTYVRRDGNDTYVCMVNNTNTGHQNIRIPINKLGKVKNFEIVYKSDHEVSKIAAPTLDIQGNFLNFKNLNIQPSGCLLIKLK